MRMMRILAGLLLAVSAYGQGPVTERKLSSFGKVTTLGQTDLVAVSVAPGTVSEQLRGITISNLNRLLSNSAVQLSTNGFVGREITNGFVGPEIILGLLTLAGGTNVAAAVLQGHLGTNSNQQLSGWAVLTPFTTLASTNPASRVRHSFRIVSLGTNRTSLFGDGGGDDEIWVQGSDGKASGLDSRGNLFASVSGLATNKYNLVRNNATTGPRAIDLGGASNLFARLMASNVVALTVDYGGRIFDLYGSQILDPTNHAASDGLYSWRGPLFTKSISITNIGHTTPSEDETPVEVPDGPGVVSYTITSPSLNSDNRTNTLWFTSVPCADLSGGGGDGWFHFNSGALEQVLLHGSGLYYSPSDSTNKFSLASIRSRAPLVGLTSGRELLLGGSNRYVSLTTYGGLGLLIDEQGRWFGSNVNASVAIYDPNTLLMSPQGDLTWGGACLDASTRVVASGGAASSLTVNGLTATNLIMEGNGVVDTNTALYVYGVVSVSGHQTIASRSAYLSLANSNSFLLMGHGAPIYSGGQEQAWLFNHPATGSNNTARLGEVTGIVNTAFSSNGLYFGTTNNPTFSAAAGSLYLSSGGGTAGTMYFHTNSTIAASWYPVKLN